MACGREDAEMLEFVLSGQHFDLNGRATGELNVVRQEEQKGVRQVYY